MDGVPCWRDSRSGLGLMAILLVCDGCRKPLAEDRATRAGRLEIAFY